jgi:cell shape-determining protein MreC
MLLWIIQNIVISVIIIFLIHNLVIYFKNSYTTKKTKDVVGFHVQKYRNIMDELQESAEKEKQVLIREAETAKQQLDTKEKTDLSEKELRSMNEDLADFIQRQIGL